MSPPAAAAPPEPGASPDASGDTPGHALRDALARLLAPLATLAVARGVAYGTVDELLRQAFVSAANAALDGMAENRRVSRISAATGLTRREVTRRVAPPAAAARGAAGAPAPPGSLASEVFAHWRADKRYRTRAGIARTLPRTGPAPSFEALAHEITRDVHPRTLLEELLRLKLAAHDAATDTVALIEAAFVPRGDSGRMLGFLGANVGDHLQAAVSNVLGEGPRHFEQAIFADGLSAASIEQLRPLLASQWQRMTDALVPALEQMIEADGAAAADPEASPRRRVRLGLYGFDAPAPAAGVEADSAVPAAAVTKARAAPSSDQPRGNARRRKGMPP